MNDDERLLFGIIGETFLKIYEFNYAGNFYLSHIGSKKRAIQKLMKQKLKNGETINLTEWSNELCISTNVLTKMLKELYENNQDILSGNINEKF